MVIFAYLWYWLIQPIPTEDMDGAVAQGMVIMAISLTIISIFYSYRTIVRCLSYKNQKKVGEKLFLIFTYLVSIILILIPFYLLIHFYK